MNKLAWLFVAIFGFSLFGGCGSQSSDISSLDLAQNPLPPCPDSPNCVRITKEVKAPVDTVFAASQQVIEKMEPVEFSVSKAEAKIQSVFRVFFFKDDLLILLTASDSFTTFLHIRSASREGYSDLGVNSRRVRKFLDKLEAALEEVK